MSTMRVVPKAVFMVTGRGGRSVTVPMMAASRPSGWRASRRGRLRRLRERRWRRACLRWRRRADRSRGVRRRRGPLRGRGWQAHRVRCRPWTRAAISLRALERPPRVGSRMQRMAGEAASMSRTRVCSAAESLSTGASKPRSFACRQDGDAVIAEEAAEQDQVAGPCVGGGELECRRGRVRCRWC